MEIDISFFENVVSTAARGSISQIEEYAFTMKSLMHSVLKQMVKNFIGIADQIKPDPCGTERLIFSGGIAERIDVIRQDIASHYPEATVLEASDETMIGLYKYYSASLQGDNKCK